MQPGTEETIVNTDTTPPAELAWENAARAVNKPHTHTHTDTHTHTHTRRCCNDIHDRLTCQAPFVHGLEVLCEGCEGVRGEGGRGEELRGRLNLQRIPAVEIM